MLRRRTVVGAVLALLTVVAGMAGAPPAAAAVSVQVEVGYGGYVLMGGSFPVAVDADVDRLVRGRIVVTATTENGPSEEVKVELPVEVPGGGAKRYSVVVPSMTTFPGSTVQVSAALEDRDGTVLGRSRQEVAKPADDRELVGLLPGVQRGRDVPAPVPLAIGAGVAQFANLGPTELASAPASLDPLGTIAAAAGDIAQLAPGDRRGLLRWLELGGTLLVDAAAGTSVEGLPEEWQPGASGAASAGRGRVRLTSGALSGGRWEGLVFPTPRRGATDMEAGFGMRSVGGSLAGDAGLRVPRLGWLLAFLMLYTLLVGPVVGFSLNRVRRAQLAWIVIPLAALVFAGGSYGAAKGLRRSARLAHGTVVEVSPAGSSATSFVGVAAQRRQTRRVSLGDVTWSARRNSNVFNQDRGGITEAGSRGPVTRLDLSGGQFAVAVVEAPIADPGSLTLSASSSADGEANGVVRNGLSTRLDEVIVVVGRRGVKVGSLGPGDEREWRTQGPEVNVFDGGGLITAEGELWNLNRFDEFESPDPDSPVNFAVWQASSPGLGMRPAGLATVVGWTRQLEPPIKVDGVLTAAKGRSAVTATVPVLPEGRVTDSTVRGESVRSSSEDFGRFGDGGQAGGNLHGLVRFLLPEGATPARPLVAHLPVGGAAELWDGRQWVSVAGQGLVPPDELLEVAPGGFEMRRRGQLGPIPMPPGADVGPGGTVRVDVPASAVVNGQVFFRLAQVGGFTSTPKLSEQP